MDVESSIKFMLSKEFDTFIEVEATKTLRVFNVSSGKESHLRLKNHDGFFTSSDIGTVNYTRKLLNLQIQNTGKNVVALGDDQGSISIYDYTSGALEAKLNEHISKVLAVKIREESNSLFSISSDKKIIHWDLSSFGAIESFELDIKTKAKEIKLDLVKQDSHLLISFDNKIVLYNMQTKKSEKKFKGHPTHINHLRVASDSKYFASLANEDAINIWSLENELPSLSISINSQTFQGLDFCKIEKGYFLVLAYSTSNWKVWMIKTTKSGVSIENELSIPFENKDLLTAKFYNRRSVMLAVMNEAKPNFHLVNLFTDDQGNQLKEADAIIENVNASVNKNNAKTDKRSKSKENKSDYHVVGEHDENFSRKAKALNGLKKSELVEEEPEAGFMFIDKVKKPKVLNQTVDGGDSLAVVLFQALHNNDLELLEFCFKNEDEDLIENTLRRLQESKILILIDKIIERLDSQKGQSNILVWLKYLLKHHAIYLIKHSQSAEKLAPLIPMLEKRTASFDKLYKVKGMIDMLLEVGESVTKDTKKQKKLTINNKPLMVYEEGEKAVQESKKKAKSSANAKNMEELEEENGQDGAKEFSDSVSDSDQEMDDEEFDAYLNEDEEGAGEEDDDKESDGSYLALE